MALILGCIADDSTGATDLASTLAERGMRTIQLIGVPAPGTEVPEADAIVIALKSRTIPAPQAVAQSCAALQWLRAAGARQFLFKYCSTFDSTAAGNIGPVADALLDALGEGFTIACPAFPTNGRTVYRGHLFVGDALLSESGMEHHPLTPMTDPNLVRVLGRQTDAAVDLIAYEVVRRGEADIRARMTELRAQGVRFAIVDALRDEHLMSIGRACDGLILVTGGSAVAMGLPENYRRRGWLATRDAATLPAASGAAAVIAGSCSPATLAQIAAMRAAGRPALAVDPLRLAEGGDVTEEVLEWAARHLDTEPVLVYASAPPEQVAEVQATLGRERAGELVEDALAAIARGLIANGVRRLVVAGGETSGAVLKALGVTALRIGPAISPGVPWTLSLNEPEVFLALKSGNFGGPRFFQEAFALLP